MSSDFRLRFKTLRSPAAQYTFALAVLTASTWIRFLLNPALRDRLPYMFYFVALAVVSVTCDLYPALVVFIGSALLTNLLFLAPQHQLALSHQDLLFGSLYLISGSTVVFAGQAYRRSTWALQEQSERLQTTLTSIGDAVIATDADGRVTLLNPLAEKLTGWSFHEAQGKPPGGSL